MLNHYVALLMPHDGGWTAVFPDLPDCTAWGETLKEAEQRAAEAAERHLATMRERGQQVPLTRDLEALRAAKTWATIRGIDWSRVVVSIIGLH
jgi:predicted RNase H-like HicB family nuclease